MAGARGREKFGDGECGMCAAVNIRASRGQRIQSIVQMWSIFGSWDDFCLESDNGRLEVAAQLIEKAAV